MIPFFYPFYRFAKSIWRAMKEPEFETLFTLVIIILLSGTLTYHGLEGWNYLDSFYFSVITLMTVGYGDLSPHTDLGKVFTIVYLFVGVGVLLSFIYSIAHHVIEENKSAPLLSERLRLRKTPDDTGDNS
ncbi:two pore domain potassium channel family protein [Candidatus Kaiserbacteria bacterium]|nr:two pore domain potassium channel family protein [Candidatus Kaiserbacteria bacterium]